MKTYNIKLKLHSGFRTPFQADTLFGHMCWVVAHQKGEEGITELLQPFKEGNPPFVISDGFPEDYLPKPMSAEFCLENQDEMKDVKKLQYVKLSDFNLIRKGEKFKPDEEKTEPFTHLTTPHNRISRLTNTVSEDGLYSLEEFFADHISIYLKVSDSKWKDEVIGLLQEVSKSGYGGKKSIGKGQFSIEEIKDFNQFEEIRDPDGFVTLSNFCPKENDPTEGLYKTFVKYGKLGEEFTFCGNPFKKPLVMIKTGSVFKTGKPPLDFYGRMVQEDISPVKKEVMQYAYAFALPIRYPSLNK